MSLNLVSLPLSADTTDYYQLPADCLIDKSSRISSKLIEYGAVVFLPVVD